MSVGLVDDHPVVRAGRSELLSTEGGIRIAGEGGGAAGALELVRTRPLHVLVLELARALQEQSVLLAMVAMVQRQEGAEQHAVRLDLVREGIDQQGRRLRELAAQAGPAATPE